MAKILIVGGAGFIGYNITKKLLMQGHRVILYDAFLNHLPPKQSHYPEYLQVRMRKLSSLQGDSNLEIVRGDIRYKSFLIDAMNATQPEIVIHLAAIAAATQCDKYPEEASAINLDGTVNVIEAMKVYGKVKRFVFTSSSFIYGNFKKNIANEEHPVGPIDIYGTSKLAGENLTRSFSERCGVEHAIVRPSAAYGATDANRRVSQIFIENAILGKTIMLYEGGEGRVDFTHVEDLADGIILAALHPKAKNQTFNMTTGASRAIKDFAEIVKKVLPKAKIEITQATDYVRPKRGTLSIKKAKDLLGYKPKYSLETGIPAYIDFVLEHKEILLA
jgi:UDP-glucose 4-epimerase